MKRTGQRAGLASGLRGFVVGFAAPWAGFRYMNRHPALWRHGILPIACNLVLSVLLLAALVCSSVRAFGWLDAMFPPGIWWLLLEILAGLLVAVAIVAVMIAGWIVFQGIFCGFFYSRLAREVEIQLGLKPEQMREVPLAYQVLDALLDLAVLTVVAVSCLLLSLVPVVGPVAAVAVGGYFDCFIFGMDYLDYPQALRARGRRVQREFARRHRGYTLGLGASVMLVTLVPLLNSVMLTSAAVGAVLLHRQLEARDAA
jgi:CysZ protein